MINPYSLLAMMQSGGNVPSAYRRSPGLTSTAGGATLARALQRISDVESLEEYQEAEAERQKWAGLGGKGLSFLGGLAGGALGGPGGAAIGAGVGQGLGEKIFGGKPEYVDRTGTVYGQQAFRDVADAGKEFQQGTFKRAGMAGLKTGLTAGLTPGGGVYGQYNPLTGTGREGISALAAGKGVTGYGGTQGLSSFATPEYAPSLDVASLLRPDTTVAGHGASFLDDVAVPDISDLFSSQLDIGGYGPSLPGGEFLSRSQDGGLIGMQDGGYGGYSTNVVDILENAGLDATPRQLKLFEEFDPTQLQQVAEGLQEGLLSGTLGAADTTATMGFAGSGAVQHAQEQQRKAAGEQFTSAKAEAAKEFESQTLGTAADIVTGGGEIKELRRGEWNPPTPPSGFTYGDTPPAMGTTHVDNNGVTWVWGYTDIMNKVTGWNRQG